MRLTFLGTGAGVPTLARNVSSVALRLPQRGEIWLFDCGEATQHQLLRSDIRTSRIRRVFITHLHGDHLYGLLGLLCSLGLGGDIQAIDLYGPPGLHEFVDTGLRLSHASLDYQLNVHVVEAGMVFQDDQLTVRCAKLDHRVPTVGYRVDERERPGHFDVARAMTLDIPAGPLYGQLKRGRVVELPDGRRIDGSLLVGQPEPGRSVVYCTDTVYSERSVALARGADLLVHEATFAECDVELARVSGHSTARMAATVAQEAGVGRLVITHLSARYSAGQGSAEALLAEARAVFPRTLLAEDFTSVEIPRRAAWTRAT